MTIVFVDVDSEKEILSYDFEERNKANSKLPANHKDKLDDVVLLAEFISLNKREGDVIIDEGKTYVVSLPPETNFDNSTTTIYIEEVNVKKKTNTKRKLGK